jgi:dephospho-CoA kinase
MLVIGLAGRAGSGKSAVARVLARQPGVEWIDLDTVAWSTYAKGTATYEHLIETFGEEIVGADGEIDRTHLARAAFADCEARSRLNAIVHPAVSDAVASIVDRHRRRGTAILLVEGALLASSAYVDRSLYDRILWLEASDAIRAERLRAAGRDAHTHRGDDVFPTGDVTIVAAAGPIDDVAEHVLEAIRPDGT